MRDGRPLFSDALGELVALTDTELTIRADGGTVTIAVRAVARAKRVPPGPRDIAALERAAAEAWPAPDTEAFGDWLLRAAGGWTSRANSALALGRPGTDLAAAIETTITWYAVRGLAPRVSTPMPASAPIARALRDRGWVAQPTTLVQTAALRAVPGGHGVHLAREPSDEWLAIVAGRKGTLPQAARHVLTAVREVRFAEVYDDRTLVGIARGAVTGGWLGLSLVDVAEPVRRQGLARRMTHALAEWGLTTGATRAYLQVEADNRAAVALYADLGFTTHHTYVTWRLPDAVDGS